MLEPLSREHIPQIAAKLDGALRSNRALLDGTRRDAVVYSIFDIEWPAVRSHLRFRLDRNG